MPMYLILISLLAGAPTSWDASTLDEQTARGEIVRMDDQSLTLRGSEGEQVLKTDRLLSLVPVNGASPTAAKEGIRVQFVDGSLAMADDVQVKSGRATIQIAKGDTVTCPARQIQFIKFLPQDERVVAMWDDIVSGSRSGDIVVVRKGGGEKPVSLDFLEGAIRDVTEATIKFEFEGDVVPVNRSRVKIEGLIYYQPNSVVSRKSICRVDTNNGARWQATGMKLVEDHIELKTPLGLTIRLPLADVQEVDYSLGKVVYLSDLSPVKNSWQPYFGSSSVSNATRQLFRVRRDETFSGDPITLGSRSFRKGLAIPSRTEISFRLPDDFGRFKAVVGIDETQKNNGHVRLVIRGDDRVLFDKPISGDAVPTELELELSGVGRLTIFVDYGEGLDIGDQLLFGGAKVIR